jgi:hypothetical protein
MRGTRWLILVAIVLLLGGVAATYRLQKRELHDEAPAKPAAMAAELSPRPRTGVHIETSEPPESRTICRITAKDARQAKDSNHVELEQVELRMPSMHADTYNLVHSAHAEYNQAESDSIPTARWISRWPCRMKASPSTPWFRSTPRG